ncbi:tRNA-specific adenosine deaminase [Methyloligella halotolerans]|uniref:tRNA-specific adenosine deaminase n=2 Tax=Methyloligella halotolerans TaxID=1177755 RepID=A0A1E2RYC0_9HYPH|nr:tRNA-specific adenosine deaminase [Methyloligella halotolerans]
MTWMSNKLKALKMPAAGKGGMSGQDRRPPMEIALEEAERAAAAGEVPVGAVIVSACGEVLSVAGNRPKAENDPTAHAELLAIREACARLGSERLIDCDLYVTLEPCAMCAAAISFARIRRLYFGAYDPKGGAVEHGPRFFAQPTCHHAPEVIGGLNETRASELLKDFFAERR